MPLSLSEFVSRWQSSRLSERSGYQQHFLDLCAVLGQPTPAESDATGALFTFEKGVTKSGGGQGFADVWLRGHFGWEYKGKHKDLTAAYVQLLQYREDLENPPLLVVCDFDRFEIHTNFTGTPKRVYAFALADLLHAEPLATTHGRAPLEVVRAAFTDPGSLRPQETTAQVTERAAAEFAKLADGLRARGEDPEAAAHFLMRLLFCLFAEDNGLLPPKLFTKLVQATATRPEAFTSQVSALFGAMASGGFFGSDDIRWFNGGLFADAAALALDAGDLAVLRRAAELDWASVEPAIFGTLFERSLDPGKRAQLGAHYTGRDDILLIVEPVLIAPLRRTWAAVRAEAEAVAAQLRAERERYRTDTAAQRGSITAAINRHTATLTRLLTGVVDEIAGTRVLDPACGSGNFLYVALKRLLDVEKEVITFGTTAGLSGMFPHTSPASLAGMEVNPYARELASVVVWIGYIQWLRDNGFPYEERPLLKRLDTIRQMDAILTHAADGTPMQPPWPEADVIIGNPPFLGGKRLRSELGDGYVDQVFRVYDGRVPREADLVTYWFERAREQIAAGHATRAGLLATNSIRGGANRRVLQGIKQSGDIFMAWGDRPWVLDGAAVRVSMVGFDGGGESVLVLDGSPVAAINADLTAVSDITSAGRLRENARLSFMGVTPGGSFDIDAEVARSWTTRFGNPNGLSNSLVVRPYYNGIDITRRPRNTWIIDFNPALSEAQASQFEQPFEYLKKVVHPERARSRTTRNEWWIHERPRPDMRAALKPLKRYIATSMVAKHRLFAWLDAAVVPANLLIVIAREDDYFFGVLHSRLHELWSLRMCTSLEDRPRYTPTTTFETFPFPWPPGQEPVDDPRVQAIGAAARALVSARDRWLNPPDATPEQLKKLTLTNLYNARPTWLRLLHETLDAAVLDAYGWPHDLDDDALLERLLALNLGRS